MKNYKAINFKKSLEDWEKYKSDLKQQLDNGDIDVVEYNHKLKAKAIELDL